MASSFIIFDFADGLIETDGTVTPDYGSLANTIAEGNDNRFSVENIIRVKKNPGAGEFSSIGAALASITTNSSSNRFMIDIGPGTYTEDTLTMKPFVELRGTGETTIIETDDPDKDLIIGTNDSSVSHVTLTGATAAGRALVRVTSTLAGNLFALNFVTLDQAETWVVCDSANFAQVSIRQCLSSRTASPDVGIHCTGAGISFVAVLSFNAAVFAGSSINDLYLVDTPTSTLNIASSAAVVVSGSITNGIHLLNGGSVVGQAVGFSDLGTTVFVENSGAAPSLTISSLTALSSSVLDVNIEHPGTVGYISGALDNGKLFVDENSSMTLAFADPDSPLTGFIVVGDILQGPANATLLNASKLLRRGSTMGLTEGGGLTREGTPLTVTVAAGSGFLEDPTGLVVEIDWSAADLVIPDDSVRWVVVNENATVQLEAAFPDNLETRIVLGRVYTLDGDIVAIEETPVLLEHKPDAIESAIRRMFGPIYVSGSLVQEGSTARTLDITGGEYYIGSYQLEPSGGTEVEFQEVIRDGSGGYTVIDDDEIVVPNNLYDNDSGTPVAVPSGEYVKHVLYVGIDEGADQYTLLYGQETYSTLNDAQNALLPANPPQVGNAVVGIAAIILQEGNANIVDIISIRPELSFRASASASVSDHGSLSGLTDDDHPQYLLVTGARALTGNLDLGSNNILNVGLIDGLDIASHGSRHNPNGADPITTAAPSGTLGGTSANQEGAANSLARSDHSHDIATANPVTQTPDQANAEGSSNSLARADHVHNIPVGTPSTTLSPATSNTEGSAATFARSDHTHAIATALVGVITEISAGDSASAGTEESFARGDHQHAVATGAASTQTPAQANAEGVSTDLARADHVHEIPVAAPSTPLSPAASNAEGSASTFSRSDHTHAIATALVGDITQVSAGTAASAGASNNYARGDHQHDIATGAPSTQTPAQANAEGSSSNLARADHTHNIPVAAPTTTLSPSTTNGAGSAATFSRSDHTHAIATALTGVISTINAGDSADGGSAGSFARGDHQHAVDTAAPSTLTPDQANSEGASTSLARADHIHQVPAAAPETNLSPATSNAEGNNASFARSNHTHAIATALVGNITTIEAGDSASAGVADNYSRGDHQHAVATGAPSTQTPAQSNAEGASSNLARADHVHNIPTASAVELTDSTNAEGGAATFARSNHTHAHGNRGGGSLHAAATTSVNGFMSAADKSKVDILKNNITFYADQFDNPVTANWAVNTLAPAFIDPANTALPVRIFANAGNPGVGFILRIPTGATNLSVAIKGRGQTAPGGTQGVVMDLYRRTINDNAAVSAWSAALALTTLNIPTNANYQYFPAQVITLASLGLTAGTTVQFELTRNSGAGADTYTGNFLMLELDIVFS